MNNNVMFDLYLNKTGEQLNDDSIIQINLEWVNHIASDTNRKTIVNSKLIS